MAAGKSEVDEKECSLCGWRYIPQFDGDMFCSDECEERNRLIDEADAMADRIIHEGR